MTSLKSRFGSISCCANEVIENPYILKAKKGNIKTRNRQEIK